MPKTTRKTTKNAKGNQASTNEIEDIKKNYRREWELIVQSWEGETEKLIKEMTRSMNSIISALPAAVAEMTVEDYINGYMKIVPESEEAERQPLKETQVNNVTSPLSIKASTKRPSLEEPSQKKRRKVKKVPTTSRVTRSKKTFETPCRSKTPLVMVEGTPMLTKHDTSHLNFTDKPRRMKQTDDITAVGFNSLTFYSSRGSPMTMENCDDEMRKKVQETLQMLMQESK